jgi:hypothetical protein
LPAFFGSAFGGGFPFAYFYTTASSISFFFTLSRLIFINSSSSSVNSSPPFFFFYNKNLLLLAEAFSARPGYISSQLFFNAFSLSSLSVSLISAIVSEEKHFITHEMPLV